MKKVMFAFVLSAVFMFSCNKGDNLGKSVDFKAEVVDTDDISCHLPLIRINPADTAAVSRISVNYTDMYSASQLPASLNTVGQKISIRIERFADGEDFICNRIGFSYAHLKVVEAVSR